MAIGERRILLIARLASRYAFTNADVQEPHARLADADPPCSPGVACFPAWRPA
jgi:hypothetical protein